MSTTLERPAPAPRPREPEATSRAYLPGRVAVGLLALVALGVAVAMALRSESALASAPLTEDGFYALNVARNMALGLGMTIDGTTATNGFQPLATFLDVVAYLVAGAGDRFAALRAGLLISTAVWIAFAVVLALGARDRARRAGLGGEIAAGVALVIALGSVSVFRMFHNGLETGLHLLVLAVAVLVLDRTERWDLRRALAIGVLLGAVVYARLDAVLFVLAVGLVATVVAVRAGRPPVLPLVACALAALLLSPWLLRNLEIDGHLMPTSGQAQSTGRDRPQNIESAVRALGTWVAAPVLRLRMHPGLGPWPTALGIAGLGLFAAALAAGLRRRGPPGPRPAVGLGTAALWLYLAAIVAFYTLNFGAWWFLDRYLAPMLLVAAPWLAVAFERGSARLAPRPRRFALPALVLLVAALNLPLQVVALGGDDPPAWASPGTNLGTHLNENFSDQTVPVMAAVSPRCLVGATESGTLGYFRDRTVNLDGKVNPAALNAIRAGDLRGYVDRVRVEIFSGTEASASRALGRRRSGFTRIGAVGRYGVWVRRGSETCLRSTPA